jgi:RNA polymerase sigma-70 factor (ECF subfamily)
MSDPKEEFRGLMRRLQAGDEAAARELLDRFGHHILRVVRRRLAKPLRSKFDSVDFVQAVWASFFAVLPRQVRFESPEELTAFLMKVAQLKVANEARRRSQKKYDIKREHALADTADRDGALAAKQPTPSQIAVAREEWDRLVEGQPNHYQQILVLRFQGHTLEEIARKLNVNERTVRRVLDKLAPGLVP